MIEWLTENARRAYPLEHAIPSDNKFSFDAWADNPLSCRVAQGSSAGTLTVDRNSRSIALENRRGSGEVYTGATQTSATAGRYTLQQSASVRYRITFDVSGTTTSSDVYLFFKDADDQYISARVVNCSKPARYSVEYTAPNGSAYAQIRFDTNNPGETSIFSNIEITEVEGSETRLRDSVTSILLDACLGYDGPRSDGRIRLISTTRSGAAIDFRIGVSTKSYLDIRVQVGEGPRSVAYAYNQHYRAFLVFSNSSLADAIVAVPDGLTVDVGVPFAHRCTSYANPRVTQIEVYAAPPCTRPVFGDEVPVLTVVGGDVTLVAHDGLDLESTAVEPLPGEVLRISALTAPAGAASENEALDLMLRSDACLSVEALPHVWPAPGGGLVPFEPDPLNPEIRTGGVLLVRQSCKPCCQCEDYKSAFDALKPLDRRIHDLADTLMSATDTESLEAGYRSACTVFTEIKGLVGAVVNCYRNVHGRATAVASGGVYSKVAAKGSRARLAVTLVVENMTLEPVTVTPVPSDSQPLFTVPGFSWVKTGDGTQDKVHWSKTCGTTRTGTSVRGRSWQLDPGHSLTVVGTFAKESTTNTGAKPAGMKARFRAKLPSSDEPYDYEVAVT